MTSTESTMRLLKILLPRGRAPFEKFDVPFVSPLTVPFVPDVPFGTIILQCVPDYICAIKPFMFMLCVPNFVLLLLPVLCFV